GLSVFGVKQNCAAGVPPKNAVCREGGRITAPRAEARFVSRFPQRWPRKPHPPYPARVGGGLLAGPETPPGAPRGQAVPLSSRRRERPGMMTNVNIPLT